MYRVDWDKIDAITCRKKEKELKKNTETETEKNSKTGA